MTIQRLGILAGLAALTTVAGAAEVVVAEFEINDHPQGGLVPPTYALRLDNIFGAYNATFSADVHNNATLNVVQDSNTNEFFIDIAGTFHGGEDLGGMWGTTFDIEASFRYGANVSQTADGWQVDGFSALNVGTLTRLDTNEEMIWYGMEDTAGDNGPVGSSFKIASDGWGIDNDDSTWVGRGWLTMNDDGSPTAAPAQDWIFTMNVIPAPSTAVMLGFSGLYAMRRRR